MCIPQNNDNFNGAQGSMALGAASTVMGAFGARAAGQAQAANYNFQAAVADMNARTAQAQAESIATAGANKASLTLQHERQVEGAQRAQLSANHLDIQAGTPLDLLADTNKMAQLDRANILYDAQNNIFAVRSQEQSDIAQGIMDRAGASEATTAGNMGAVSALLTGSSKLANQYSAFQSTGAIGSTTTTTTQKQSILRGMLPYNTGNWKAPNVPSDFDYVTW